MRRRLVVPCILCLGFTLSACLETRAVSESRSDEIQQDESRIDETVPDQSQADKPQADKPQADKPQAGNVSPSKEAALVKDAERVYGIEFDGNAVMAKVISTGCTSSEHFEVVHEVREARCYLTLVRNKPDFCRRAPFAMDVIVPFTPPAACSALPVAFDNEIVEFQDKSTPSSTQRQPPGQ